LRRRRAIDDFPHRLRCADSQLAGNVLKKFYWDVVTSS
jgi:hypothetical protein